MSGPVQRIIRIVNDHSQKFQSHRNLVLPPIQILNYDDQVIFEAVDTDVTVIIPNANELFGQSSPEKNLIIEIPAGDLSDEWTIDKDAALNKVYPYAVYCSEGNDFAVGYSSPKIIIE
ncbi:hypothetical protein GF407_00645 [candidate division KSB1 bacterium]|nr:hypothetical protein [candidate division KSB1 bacterium]